MSEIQLWQICDGLENKNSAESVDGQETMTKNGRVTSKFCKDAVHIASPVPDRIKQELPSTFDSNSGDDSVFPTRNGCDKNTSQVYR